MRIYRIWQVPSLGTLKLIVLKHLSMSNERLAGQLELELAMH